MDFNEEQKLRIEQFLKFYYNSDIVKEWVLCEYLTSPSKLDILRIYILEEILRVGHKNIFNEFLKTIPSNKTLSQTIIELEELEKTLIEDVPFCVKMHVRYTSEDKSLTNLELFCLRLINDNSLRKVESLTYDEFNPIKYASDEEIRETFYNLIIGKLVLDLLEIQEFHSIKRNQKVEGQISNVEKNIFLAAVQGSISDIQKNALIIEEELRIIKKRVLNGEKEQFFKECLKFNTNISFQEVLRYKNRQDQMKLILNKPINE